MTSTLAWQAPAVVSTASVVLGAAQVIDQQTLMPLSLMVGGVAGTAWITWRVAQLLHRVVHRLDRVERRIGEIDRRRDQEVRS